MKIKLHHIDNSHPIQEDTIITLTPCTYDADAQGYERTDGTQRGLCAGQDTDGIWIIYMTTNGDDVACPDDIDDARDWCRDMGDAPDDDDDRIRTGADRLLDAAHELIQLHPEATDDMEWYSDKAREVLSTLDN